jgi:type IV pilus assembly protein PilN
MMIRINLLPVRQVKKREAGRQFIVALAGFLAIALVGNGYWFYLVQTDREKQQRLLDDTRARIDQLKKVIGEVDNLNRRQKEVKEKLDVLRELSKRRAGPVKLLDALALAIPKKVWVVGFDETSAAVKMTGAAESYDDVSEFMKGLSSVVWTPKGMGRVVEVKRDGSSARVELVGGTAIEDFPGAEVSHFFSNIDLRNSAMETGKVGRTVNFELSLNVNYAI